MNKNGKFMYNFGVTIDLLPDYTVKRIRDRVTQMRDWAVRNNYQSLDETAERYYQAKKQQESQYGIAKGKRPATLSGQRFHLLCTVKRLVVMCTKYADVTWEVTSALKAGTPVVVFNPYREDDLVELTSPAQWDHLLNEEANPYYAAWKKELGQELQEVLSTPTPWLGTDTLQAFTDQFKSCEQCLSYMEDIIHAADELGDWDLEYTTSLVLNEKASVARFVGRDGRRTTKSAYKYGKTEYWFNYEVLPKDIMTMFLHLTFLQSVDYKPLQRVMTDGIDFMENVFPSRYEDTAQGYYTTPLYVDPLYDETKGY